jgi:DNA replication and repair protein RecF
MWINGLTLKNFRIFDDFQIDLRPQLQLIVGANGSGKTSILEAIYMLAFGRSFREKTRNHIYRQGTSLSEVFLDISDQGIEKKLNFRASSKGGQRYSLNEGAGATKAEFVEILSCQLIHPDSHRQMAKDKNYRRKLLNWGVFHVKPSMIQHWANYQKAMKQRAELLRQQAGSRLLCPWEEIMAKEAAWLTDERQKYIQELGKSFKKLRKHFDANNTVELLFHPGYSLNEDFTMQLEKNRREDFFRGYAIAGAHRADIEFNHNERDAFKFLSQGQVRMLGMSFLLAQLEFNQTNLGRNTFLMVDDLDSELDFENQKKVLSYIKQSKIQALVTSVNLDEGRWQEGVFQRITPL